MRDWRSIKTAPKDGTEIIVLDGGQPEFAHWEQCNAYSAGGSWRARSGCHVFLPLKWTPIPDAQNA